MFTLNHASPCGELVIVWSNDGLTQTSVKLRWSVESYSQHGFGDLNPAIGNNLQRFWIHSLDSKNGAMSETQLVNSCHNQWSVSLDVAPWNVKLPTSVTSWRTIPTPTKAFVSNPTSLITINAHQLSAINHHEQPWSHQYIIKQLFAMISASTDHHYQTSDGPSESHPTKTFIDHDYWPPLAISQPSLIINWPLVNYSIAISPPLVERRSSIPHTPARFGSIGGKLHFCVKCSHASDPGARQVKVLLWLSYSLAKKTETMTSHVSPSKSLQITGLSGGLHA